jgi:molybdopterin-guanine dinucleotide biosynthesis protein A
MAAHTGDETPPGAGERRVGDHPRFTGAVLAGGASRRMGQDKAFVDWHGRPLVAVAAAALAGAGAAPVLAIGGDAARLRDAGLVPVSDDHPGEGPLGGILTALAATAEDLLVVLTCDLAAVGRAEVAAVVVALAADPEADVAAPLLDGRPQFLSAAYRRRAAGPLGAAFAAGERAVRRAVSGSLRLAEVHGLDPARLVDLDTPDDLLRARH